MRPGNTRGFALLEAVLALAVLGSGLVMLAVVSESVRLEQGFRERERIILEASRVMTAMSFLSRSDLDRRLGIRDVRGLAVEVSRPTPTVYRISLAEPESRLPLLVTLVYRR